MTDDLHPQGPNVGPVDGPIDPVDPADRDGRSSFADALAGRLARTAEPVGRRGPTLADVERAVASASRSRQRRRVSAVAAAAAVVLVAGVAVASGGGSNDRTRFRTGDERTSSAYSAPCSEPVVEGTSTTAASASGAIEREIVVRAEVLQAKVQDLLDAVGPDDDSSFPMGPALLLLGVIDPSSGVTPSSDLPPEFRRFAAAVDSVDLARWDRVRDRGAAALTEEQRAAIAGYEPGLPSKAGMDPSVSGPARSPRTATTSADPAAEGCDTTTAESMAAATTVIAGQGGRTTSTSVVAGPDANATTAPATPAEGAATLAIRVIGLSAPVRPGKTQEVLDQGLGFDPDSPPAGDVGNVVIYGHRTTYGQEFLGLDQLAEGDTIQLATDAGRFTYRVDGSPETIDPFLGAAERFGPLGEGPGRLTLVTSTPTYSAEQRLVVKATLVATEP
ncbi:hypothetical protein BH10ACT1_BH10ACT1_15410 [soil metagenome]